MKERLIDATGLILGRLCSHVAKHALLGETIAIVNIDKAVITGRRHMVFDRYKMFRAKGTPVQGPFIPRRARELFKRSLKRMLPFKIARGQEALARVKAYKGLPARYAEMSLETLPFADVSKVPTTKYVTLQEVTAFIGGK
ncbi:MAG TPA: 50S ribosomal protein L13 [Candidatus Nanoarchaeia archaeon]|nr:50S ribosomal protein L13 [Candidatus Nanoarchaeia archaeon]